ncbi:MAG: thiamine pyrophosphate-binding protein [bacterium]|nr:thiamine pyrophosphate-binding protein [Gammaproteobacteria bacterium]HIL98412.1 thiamine pyrophosphate-binding protein [Pseudomonadales bacterium]
MANLTGGDAVYQTLLAAGVDHVFGIVSVHNIPIYDAILRGGKIRTIDVRHEQGALHAADGYSRATGKLGVAITSTGPGAANGMTGLFEAGFSSSRVLMITGQTETGHYGKGKGVLHEAENQLAMLRSVTRVTESPRRVTEIPELLGRVIRDIMTGRPQPGAIEIPVDLQYAQADFDIEASISGDLVTPDSSSISQAASVIADSKKRVILAGGGVIRSEATEELIKLAEALDAPVYTTVNGRGAIPEDHPLSMGTFLLPAAAEVAKGDLMIAVGTRFQGGSTANFSFQPPAKLIHIDADNHMLNLNYAADVAVVGDARSSLSAICDHMNAEAGDSDFKATLEQSAKDARAAVRERMGPDFELIMDCIRDNLPRLGNIVRDATIPAYVWGNTLIPIFEPRTSIHSTSAAIGPGLPLAIGASLGSGEKSVVIQGDGGFMLNIAELATAAQYSVPVVICVFNDKGYGVLRRIQSSRFEGRNTGVNLSTPDFAKVAQGMGIKGVSVQGSDGFETAFKEAMAHEGPVLLDIDQSTLQSMKLPF